MISFLRHVTMLAFGGRMAKGFANFVLLSFIVSSAWAQTNNIERLNSLRDVTRIAFGSCNDQNDAQPLWQDLQKTNPDLFIWGGDVIYADWEDTYNMSRSYDKQSQNNDYMTFKSKTPIIGTWDDHDYGWDNADGTLVSKKNSQKNFLDFLEEPAGSLRRMQDGVYTSYDLGSEGRKVKVILLDNRFFKNLDANYPILGKTQWDWLENQFKTSTADIHFVVSGLAIFSPLIPYTEEWTEHFSEVQRMLDLIKKYNPKGIMFLTGDKHFAAISQNYGQLEFMSSGMTHVAPRRTWWYLARKYPLTYFGLNYGLIDIDWNGSTPKVKLAIRSTGGTDIHPTSYIWKNNRWEWQK